MTIFTLISAALVAFGLGDVVDVLESDDLQDALDVVESFSRASGGISDVEEYYLGRSVAATVLNMYSPLQNDQVQLYINQVGQSVATASPKPSIFNGYHFMLLDSDQINAIACPGGLILICTGLTDLATNEDELAAILAHEVSHVALRHGVSSIDQARWTEFGALVASQAAERSGNAEIEQAADEYGNMVEEVVSNIINRGYSRETEYQADSLAAVICANAGYSPEALSSVLQNMGAMTSRSGPGFWQTHPSPEDRISAVNNVIATLPGIPVDPARTARFQASMSAQATGGSSGGRVGTTTPDTGDTGSSGGRGGTTSPSGDDTGSGDTGSGGRGGSGDSGGGTTEPTSRR